MSLPPYDQSVRDFERHFQVVLPDAVGQATVGFREGVWFRLNSGTPHPVPIRSAIILCPHAAGSIVQIVCWWMRENPRAPRALDLATELALTVGELARKAIEDDPLGMSLTTLPPASAHPAAAALGGPSLGSVMGPGPYEGGPYGTDPYSPAPSPPSPYEPAYAAATTMIPQITPDMIAPGRPLGGTPRPPGPVPGLAALPPSAGRPGPAAPGPGFAPRGPVGGGQGPMPGGRPPMGQPGQPGQSGQSGSWDRPAPGGGYDQRGGRPAGGPPPRQGGYEGGDPRDEYFRGGPPPQQQRRPERDEYDGGRPQQGRPGPSRQDPNRAW
jgi:hypothetical protein